MSNRVLHLAGGTEADLAQLRAAMPELFDAGAVVEGALAVITGAHDRTAADLVTIEEIAEEAGWTRELGELRSGGERAREGTTTVVP